jgi:hypothetical protein
MILLHTSTYVFIFEEIGTDNRLEFGLEYSTKIGDLVDSLIMGNTISLAKLNGSYRLTVYNPRSWTRHAARQRQHDYLKLVEFTLPSRKVSNKRSSKQMICRWMANFV